MWRLRENASQEMVQALWMTASLLPGSPLNPNSRLSPSLQPPRSLSVSCSVHLSPWASAHPVLPPPHPLHLGLNVSPPGALSQAPITCRTSLNSRLFCFFPPSRQGYVFHRLSSSTVAQNQTHNRCLTNGRTSDLDEVDTE